MAAKAVDYDAIMQQFTKLQNQANAANEQRYTDILGSIGSTTGTVRDLYGQTDDLLANLGDTEHGRIDQGATQARGSAYQDLVSRGLGNTTITSSVDRGITDDTNRAHAELNQQVANQKAAVLQSQAGAEERIGEFLANMMNARTDQGPDTNALLTLLQQAGAGQGALDTAGQTLFTGLSANARAGLDAFGQPSGSSYGNSSRETTITGGSSGGGSSYGSSGGGGGGVGGGGGNVAQLIRSASNAGAQQYATSAGSAGGVGGGGGNAAQAGVGGQGPGIQPNSQVFDDMFRGQPVYAGGNTLGEYTGGGTVSDDRELVDAFGDYDSSRTAPEQGGSGPPTPSNGQNKRVWNRILQMWVDVPA